MATDESSLTDFEYRVVGVPTLEGRVYNREHHAKAAIRETRNMWRSFINENPFPDTKIEIRLVSRGEWKSNIREVFGLE